MSLQQKDANADAAANEGTSERAILGADAGSDAVGGVDAGANAGSNDNAIAKNVADADVNPDEEAIDNNKTKRTNPLDAEPTSKKVNILAIAACQFIAYAVIGGLYAARWANVNQLQTEWEDNVYASRDDKKNIFYDIAPLVYPDWSDAAEASDLIADLGNFSNRDDGCQWSVIYTLNCITLLLFALNSILQMIGAKYAIARMCGLCCCLCLSCANFAAIIVTGVYRFNTIGKLVALSNVSSEYDGGKFTLNSAPVEGRTYVDEGKWIIGLGSI